jgi:copper chaperone
MQSITFVISGMSCGHCLHAVRRALARVPGLEVESVQIGRARVRVSDAGDAAERARAAIEEAGYTVEAVDGLGA